MALMVVCGVLVLLGLVAVLRWGGHDVRRPETGAASPGAVLRQYASSLSVALVAGLGAGVLIAGAGGRLAMRLLAVTAGADVQGRITEADEVVGRITTGGTRGFIVFTALFFGVATGALYLLLHRFLPRGRWAGLAFGVLLLVLAATRIDPLREDNPDFDIVGPGWLAALVLGAVVLVHGLAVAALAGRYSQALPPLSSERGALVAHAPLLLLALSPVAVLVAALGALVLVVFTQVPSLSAAVRSRYWLVVWRAALLGLVLAAAPGFLSAMIDISARRP